MSENWEYTSGRIKYGQWTLADVRYAQATLARIKLMCAAPELAEGLRHQIYRDHPYSENCSACFNGAKALQKAGLL